MKLFINVGLKLSRLLLYMQPRMWRQRSEILNYLHFGWHCLTNQQINAYFTKRIN